MKYPFKVTLLTRSRPISGTYFSLFTAPEAFDESFGAPMVSITVDAAEESDMEHQAKPKWVPWTDAVSPPVLSILSTNAPLQPPSVYFLASMSPPLLAAILDNIDFGLESAAPIDVLHRLHRLVDLLVTAKVDTYLDLLEVVAYHSSKSRHAAASMLSALWPKGMGHVIISSRSQVLHIWPTPRL